MTQEEINAYKARVDREFAPSIERARKNDIFTPRPARKLITGILFLSAAILHYKMFGGSEIIDNWAQGYLVPLFGRENGLFFSALIDGSLDILSFVFAIKGLYRIYTFNQVIDAYDIGNIAGYEISQNTSSSNSDTNNIDSAYAYRNAKAQFMTPDKAAEFYMETSRLSNSNMDKSTRDYVNSKMGMMSSEGKLNFLRGKK